MDEVRRTYTVREAAEIVGISSGFAYVLAGRGELPVIRLGRKMLVPRDALERWMNQHSAQASA
ncbi:MAG: helix-turn-helix domain-containing protein [Chloroflexi bacterium]|nr:helix-turn-helix domain-containing protein [Chloroflexota bacterium]